MWFLFHFSDRHAKFRNMMAFPLAPVSFAEAGQYLLAFVLDRDHQIGFLLGIGRSAMQHPDGSVGPFGDQDSPIRFDVDGLPRSVQIEAEGFVHNGSSII